MNIAEAIQAVSDEYDQEVLSAEHDVGRQLLAKACIHKEYEEIDQKLGDYVGEIAATMGVRQGTEYVYLPEYVYQAARMCFRLGMRVQRKIDHPDQTTTMFWRSDEAKS